MGARWRDRLKLRRCVGVGRQRVRLLQHVGLGALQPRRGLGVAGLHAEDSPPRVRGLARVLQLLLPHTGDLARELGAGRHVLAAQDLILVQLHHAAVVAEKGQQRGQLVHHLLVGGGEIVQLLEVGGGALLVVHLLAPQLGPAAEQLADERPIEDLAQRPRQRLLGALVVSELGGQRLEIVERLRVDVGDEGVAQPGERLVDVAKRVVDEPRGSPEQDPTRTATVARALPARRHRGAEDASQLLSTRCIVALGRGLLEGREDLLRRGRREREIEEPARPLDLPLGHRDLRRARQRSHSVRRGLAARHLALVEVDHLGGLSRELPEALQERLHLGGRHAGQPGLAVLDGLAGGHPGLDP